ncbi:MAG TPA: hypothetical protein VEL12_14530 [Candidatus Nitrosopolaris sp.]|nr:hypothetical protein [Candidatus Nitrosopolaris sp.]
MSKGRTLLIASAVAAAMVSVGVMAASAASRGNTPANFLAAASPSPSPGSFKSNETAAHEAGETAAHEAAENNGTFRPGGPGGPSNETSAHEAGETAAQEAAENARASASPTP